MLYHIYEMNHAALAPMRAAANAGRFFWKNPLNPLVETPFAKVTAAGLDMFERVTRRYGKPEFGISDVWINGKTHAVEERVVWSKPFCNLLHFTKEPNRGRPPEHRRLLRPSCSRMEASSP